MATYRPVDQVKVDVVDTEVLQSGVEALLNALVGGVRELTRDLPEKKPVQKPAESNSNQ